MGHSNLTLTLRDEYLARLVVYIHWNPQKHGFITDFRDYPYSSYAACTSNEFTHVKRDVVLDWFGGKEGFIAAHREYRGDQEISHLTTDDWE